MIRTDSIWRATEPMDMRVGTETALAKVIAVFGAAQPHCAYGQYQLLPADSVEKVGISGWKKATLALVSELGHHVAWLSSSALTVAAWLIG